MSDEIVESGATQYYADQYYRQFMRKCRIMVLPSDTGQAYDVSNLRCTFSIEKALSETPNFAQIAIYNTSLEFRSMIAEKGGEVTVEAGYEGGTFGMIFRGRIIQIMFDYEGGVDTVLTLVCQDGDVFLNSQIIMGTMAAGSTGADVVNACSQKIEKGVISDAVQTNPLPRGRVLFGKASDYVRQVTHQTNTQMYVDDGVLNIVASRDYGNVVIELHPDNALLGEPSQTDDGVSAKCLLNPSMRLNSIVYICSAFIKARVASPDSDNGSLGMVAFSRNGLYRILKITYEGDTRGDAWFCNFEAIAQDGRSPAGKSESSEQLYDLDEEIYDTPSSSSSGSKTTPSKQTPSDDKNKSTLYRGREQIQGLANIWRGKE